MIEFIDKTSEQDGTSLNRANMMAIQGFVACSCTIDDDGKIVQINDSGERLTINPLGINGQRVIILEGEKTITLTITYTSDGIRKELT